MNNFDLINIKILSNIQKSDKISIFNDKIYIDKNTWKIRGIYRFIFKQNRKNSILRLKDIVESSLDYGNSLMNIIEKNDNNFNSEIDIDMINYINQLSISLKDSLNGINNLKYTYESDDFIKNILKDLESDINYYIINSNNIISKYLSEESIL
tara:strand:+ start:19 stop:477 length:459 start_codon:yes stop_codon:yes gene_type:complete